jgi:hypothetical protein
MGRARERLWFAGPPLLLYKEERWSACHPKRLLFLIFR